MTQEFGNFYVVPTTLTTVGGLHLAENTYLWIPGEVTSDSLPKHLYGLDHPWDHLQPDEEIVTMVPTMEDWLQLHLFIADSLLVKTTRGGQRL